MPRITLGSKLVKAEEENLRLLTELRAANEMLKDQRRKLETTSELIRNVTKERDLLKEKMSVLEELSSEKTRMGIELDLVKRENMKLWSKLFPQKEPDNG